MGDIVGTPILEAPTAEGSNDQHMVLNMGPQHPSTHGVLRLVLEIDGEIVVRLYPEIGYLHTGIEKTCEAKFYQQVVPLTDRVDYLGPMANNLCYCLAVEKLLQLEIPDKAQWMRVLLTELTRLNSHLIWLGTHAMDIGALTVFLYTFREREEILRIFEMVSGQRMMTSYFRIGGLAMEPPLGLLDRIQAFIKTFPEKIDEYSNLLTGNPIFVNRLKGVGYLSARKMPSLWASPGRSLRASGIDFDLRRDMPYCSYEKFQFKVPVSNDCDVLGALRAPPRRDARERQDHPAGARRHARRAGQGQRAQDRAARPREDEDADGVAHPSLQDRDRRLCRAGRRGLSGH